MIPGCTKDIQASLIEFSKEAKEDAKTEDANEDDAAWTQSLDESLAETGNTMRQNCGYR